MCTPLATATDSLIFLVSFCSWMRVHPWMFWLCITIVLLYCIVCCIYSLPSPMSTGIFILLTLLSARGFHFVLLTCIELLYWLVLLYWIALLCCVFAYSPSVFSEYRFHHSPHPHVCLCVFLLQEGRFTLYYSLSFAYWHWHWPFLMIICLLPQLLRAVAPALTLITFF